MRRLLLALAAAAFISPAFAQITPYPAGPSNQSNLSLVAPTAPPGDNSDRVANTAFVTAAVGSASLPGLPSAQIWIGSGGGVATARTMSGDATLSNLGVLTFATVNANVGTFGSATQCVALTTNAKGLITAASQTACTPAVGSITGLGTGVATALGVNIGSAGAPVLFNGAGGTPTSLGLANATGLPVSTGISGLGTGVATALGINTGLFGSFVVMNGVLGTPSSGSAANLTAFSSAFDANFCSTQGSVLYRNAANWVCLAPGTSGQLLSTNGAAANPSWITASGTGTVTSVVCNGVTITGSGTCPPAIGFSNCAIVGSVSGNNVTVTLTDNAGATPSASSPCNAWFRSATAAPTAGSAQWVQRTVTSATTFTANAGSTFGITNTSAQCLAASSCPFKLWVTLIDTGATAVLGVVALTNASGVLPLDESQVVTTTACSACAGATTLGTMYSTAAQTSKAFVTLGALEWGSGLATAGTYASGPTLAFTLGPGVKRPGEVVQDLQATTSTASTGTVNAYGTGAAPANAATVSITPRYASNLLHANFDGQITTNSASAATAQCRMFRGASGAVNTAIGNEGNASLNFVGSGNTTAALRIFDTPGVATAIQYTQRVKNSDNSTTVSCPASNGLSGIIGVQRVVEIMG